MSQEFALPIAKAQNALNTQKIPANFNGRRRASVSHSTI